VQSSPIGSRVWCSFFDFSGTPEKKVSPVAGGQKLDLSQVSYEIKANFA
jgi:hypothetical protein